jgi:hypothetical protein
MVGTTLSDIRDHVKALATETGEYSIVCARYGDRSVPATGLRFGVSLRDQTNSRPNRFPSRFVDP